METRRYNDEEFESPFLRRRVRTTPRPEIMKAGGKITVAVGILRRL